jgi:F-type H+-transporting ATPase subunit alpha
MKKVAGRLKLELSQYRDLEAFAQFGSDLDADTQATLARGERLVKTLNQNERSPMAVEEQVVVIYAATNGFLDRISVNRVPEFHQDLVSRMRAENAEVLEKIAGGSWDDDVVDAVHKAVEEFSDDFGQDLDEDGVPVDTGDDDDSSSAETRVDNSVPDAEETADEPEKEAAPA